MRVILFGGSGMVGQGVLRECLLDATVEAVLSVGRSATGQTDPKLREIRLTDLTNLAPVEGELRGYDATFFCLGVSSAGMNEVDYRKVTFDLTVSAGRTLSALNPGMTFIYVSGAGTDSTENGRAMWARVKGQTENAVLNMPFKAAYMFRPGIIQPRHGIRSKTRSYRILYAILSPIVLLLRAVAPDSITTTENMGRAMIHVVERGVQSPILTTRDINRLAQ